MQSQVSDFKEQYTKASVTQRAQEAEQTKLSTFYDEHGSELFLNPDLGEDGGLTPLGVTVKQAFHNDPKLQSTTSSADRLELAYDRAAPQPLAAKAAPQPSRAAKHQPTTNATPKQMTRDEYWKKYPNNTLAQAGEYFGELETSVENS